MPIGMDCLSILRRQIMVLRRMWPTLKRGSLQVEGKTVGGGKAVEELLKRQQWSMADAEYTRGGARPDHP